MNCTVERECDREEKKVLGAIQNQNVLEEVSMKTSELAHQKKLAKDEVKELNELKDKNQSIIEQVVPVQNNYKITRNALKQIEDCISQRKLKIQQYDHQICELKKRIQAMEDELQKLSSDEAKNLRTGEVAKSALSKEYDELRNKLYEMKSERCNSNNVFGADDIEGQLATVTKEFEELTQQGEELQVVINKAEKHVHEIANKNMKMYEEIKDLEDSKNPLINNDITNYQQTLEQQGQQLKKHTERRSEQLSMNEQIGQKISQYCVKKIKLATDLRQSLENCQRMKEDRQKKIQLEERLVAKIECLKQQNKQLMHRLATLEKRLENRSCNERSSIIC